jgi:hypothetical protein
LRPSCALLAPFLRPSCALLAPFLRPSCALLRPSAPFCALLRPSAPFCALLRPSAPFCALRRVWSSPAACAACLNSLCWRYLAASIFAALFAPCLVAHLFIHSCGNKLKRIVSTQNKGADLPPLGQSKEQNNAYT